MIITNIVFAIAFLYYIVIQFEKADKYDKIERQNIALKKLLNSRNEDVYGDNQGFHVDHRKDI